MTVIGSAYVNIRAITDKLESDVRSAIDKLTDTVTIKVDADVTQAHAKIKSLTDDLSEHTIRVTADTTDAQTSLDAIADDALGEQRITVDADTLPARREFENMVDDMDGRNVHVPVDVDDAAARARLALLTIARRVKIAVIADSSPLNRLGTAIARLSGLRVATAYAKNLVHEFANIDKMVGGVSKMAVLFGTIGGAIMSSVGGLSTLIASLGSIITMAAIAAPGMATGFVVGIGTLMVALKDFKNQLPDVVAQYKTLTNTVRGNFWYNAREPIRDMATKLFPQMKDGLASVSGSLGEWAASFAAAIKTSLGGGVLRTMFERLAVSIDIAKKANKPFVESMVTLGKVGSDLLPRLAKWWVDVATKFNNFISKAAKDGSLNKWVEEGISALKDLGKLIGEVSGFFGGITEAARNAGSDGLSTLLDVFTRLNDAVNSPTGMKALTTIFEGANSVADALANAVSQIFGALATAAPSIKSAFESVSGVIGSIAGALSKLIANPEFQKGFSAMFDGIEEGAANLFSVIGTTGPKLGALMSIIGALASNIGSILGKALEVTLPLITAFKQAIDPLIPILGDALTKMIGDLGPVFAQLGDVITQMAPALQTVVKWISELATGFVDWIAPALPEIIAGVLGFIGAWKAVTAVQAAISTVKAGITGMQTAMAAYRAGLTLATAVQIAFNGAMIANPVGLIVAGIVALVAVIVVAYNNVGWFKDFVDSAFKMIGDIVGNLVSFWNTEVVPMWNNAMKAAGDFFGAIGKWVGEAIQNVQNFFGGFGKGAGDAAGAVGGFFDGIGSAISGFVNGVGEWFGGIGKGIGDAFSAAVAFVAPIIETIGTIISTGVNNIVTGWTIAFNTVRDVFVNVWNGLVWFFGPIVELIYTIITGAFTILITFWTMVWEIVSTIFIGVWNKIVEFITPIVQFIVDTITTVIGNIVSWWTTTWQAISDFFGAIWNGIVAFVTAYVNNVVLVITTVVGAVVGWWNATWQSISDFFAAVWNGIVAFISPIISAISAVITNVINGISAAWNAVWSAISSFFMGIWNGIVGFVSGVVANIQARIAFVMAYIQALWNAGWAIIGSVINNVWTTITNVVSGIVRTVQTKIGEVVSFFTGLPGKVLGALGSFAGDMINVGRNVVQGLIDGARGMIDNAVQAIKDVGGAMLGGIKSFLGIKSPSREFMKIGHWVSMGLAEGITGGTKPVVRRIQNLAQRITDAASEHFKRANMQSVIRAGQRGMELYQGRELDRVAAQVRAQVGVIGRLAAQKESLTAKLKTAQTNLNKALEVQSKEAASVAKNLAGEFKLSNFVGQDAAGIAEGATDVANRIKAFGAKINQLRGLGLSPALIAEVAGLGSSDGTEVADALLEGGKGQVAVLNQAYASIGTSAKIAGAQVAGGMYGAGVNALQGLVNGFKKNIASVDSAARTVANRLLAQVKKTLGIRSPSRVFRDEIGKQIGAGLAQGIRDSMSMVSSAADDLLIAATPDMSSLSFGVASRGPVLTAGTVTGANGSTAPTGASQLAGATGNGPTVIINPSAAMDETAIGRAAVRELNWQLLSS